MARPISDFVVHIKKSVVDKEAPTLAGIDRGCSLTKAIYLPKNGKEDTATHYAFHVLVYSNDNFVDCIKFIKANARLPQKGIIRITGAGGDKYREDIAKILGLEIQFIAEHITAVNGVYFLLKNADKVEDCFYPEIKLEGGSIQYSAEVDKMAKEIENQVSLNDGKDSIFPFIFCLVGSGVGLFQINADGTMKSMGFTMVGGVTLLALGSALANISDYNALMTAAKAGNCSNVDTTAGDFMRKDKDSNYGDCPESLSIFSFGKLVDQKKSLDKFDQKDRAASTVHLFSQVIASLVMTASQTSGLSKVVFGGHGIEGEPVRRQIAEFVNSFLPGAMTLKFLKTGGTGALGAMLGDK